MAKNDGRTGYTGPEIKTPVKAIRAFCLECSGGSRKDLAECTAKDCTLYPFRFGKNPYYMASIAAGLEKKKEEKEGKEHAET